jgi:hypothetical protein
MKDYYDAAEAHPGWDRDGDRLICRNPRTRQNTPERLVAWYRASSMRWREFAHMRRSDLIKAYMNSFGDTPPLNYRP